MGLLQIGLEEKGDVAVGAMALVDLFGQDGEPLSGPGAPQVEGPGQKGRHHVGIPGHRAAVEQAELGPEVLGGDLQDLGRPADRVVEAHALVPDRVPDGVGDGADVAPTLVDEDHVEVAARAQLAAAVAADRHQGEVAEISVGGMVEEPGQPAVGDPGQGMAEVVTVQVGSLEKLLAQRAERHERRYHRSPRTGTGGAGVAWRCRRRRIAAPAARRKP